MSLWVGSGLRLPSFTEFYRVLRWFFVYSGRPFDFDGDFMGRLFNFTSRHHRTSSDVVIRFLLYLSFELGRVLFLVDQCVFELRDPVLGLFLLLSRLFQNSLQCLQSHLQVVADLFEALGRVFERGSFVQDLVLKKKFFIHSKGLQEMVEEIQGTHLSFLSLQTGDGVPLAVAELAEDVAFALQPLDLVGRRTNLHVLVGDASHRLLQFALQIVDGAVDLFQGRPQRRQLADQLNEFIVEVYTYIYIFRNNPGEIRIRT